MFSIGILGFTMDYSANIKIYLFALIGCGQVLNNTLTSPGYPNNYPNDLYCVYLVPIQPGKAMNIYFDEFNVEDTFHCIE